MSIASRAANEFRRSRHRPPQRDVVNGVAVVTWKPTIGSAQKLPDTVSDTALWVVADSPAIAPRTTFIPVWLNLPRPAPADRKQKTRGTTTVPRRVRLLLILEGVAASEDSFSAAHARSHRTRLGFDAVTFARSVSLQPARALQGSVSPTASVPGTLVTVTVTTTEPGTVL